MTVRSLVRALGVWIACSILLSHCVASASVPDGHPLDRDVWVLEDPDGSWSVDDVSSPEFEARFERAESGRPAVGYSASAFWFRVDLPEGQARRLLEVAYSQNDELTIYRRRDGAWFGTTTGDTFPMSTRELQHRHPVFELAPDPQRVYLRVRSSGSIHAPLRLWTEDGFVRADARANVGFGIYYAFIAGLVLYNLFLFFAIRARVYLFYVGYLLAICGAQAALEGHLKVLLWPDSTWWASVAGVTLICVSLCSGNLFIRDMTDAPKLLPRLSRAMFGGALAFLLLIPLLWLDYTIFVRVVVAAVLTNCLFLAAPILMSYRRGYRPARFVLVGYCVLIPAGIVMTLRNLDVIGPSFIADHGMRMATAAEALFLSFALADRINLLGRQRDDALAARLDAERTALEAQRHFSRKLIDAQDAERKRIAAELHDGVGQNLLALTTNLERLDQKQSETGRPESLGRLGSLANETVDDLRNVARALHPHQLDRLGLKAAVEAVVNQALENREVDFECVVNDVDGSLPKNVEIHVYRILQEALSNIVHHSNARTVTVTLRREAERVVLSVEDDGQGLPEDPNGGLGLRSMRERARLVGATLEISSDEGARIRLDVPRGG